MGKGDGRASIAETAETPVARVAQRDRRTSLRSRVGGRCHGTRRFTSIICKFVQAEISDAGEVHAQRSLNTVC